MTSDNGSSGENAQVKQSMAQQSTAKSHQTRPEALTAAKGVSAKYWVKRPNISVFNPFAKNSSSDIESRLM